ncbi:MAG: ABC transporter permease [Bacillales bacterium]
MKKEENNFIYFDSKNQEHKITIKEDDFNQVNIDKKIHDLKFNSKPTTFFKDALKRFVKNKSSVGGGIILGVIILFAIILPMILQSDIKTPHIEQRFLLPKIFDNANGFWDGTKRYDSDIVFDIKNETPAGFVKEAVSDLTYRKAKTNLGNKYATGGQLRFVADRVYDVNKDLTKEVKYLESYKLDLDLSKEYKVSFDLTDQVQDKDYNIAPYRFYVSYYNNENKPTKSYYSEQFSSNYKVVELDLTSKLKSVGLENNVKDVKVGIEILPSHENKNALLIRTIKFSVLNDIEEQKRMDSYSMLDAAQQVILTVKDEETNKDNINYFNSNGSKFIYQSDIYYCHFKYDVYKATYGDKIMEVSSSEIKKYVKQGLIKYDFKKGVKSFEIIDKENSPIKEVYEQYTNEGVVTTYSLKCKVTYYKYLGYSKMPKFIFGTDSLGKDFIHIIFKSLRTSLVLGVVTSLINFIIGIIWGSFSGYFGGWTDLLMERFTDILGRVPWIVIMTLCILYLGQNFLTFTIALCITGWMGVAATTRAQFYRFKGREYVLASRTLGSSDTRLIFKHILPNSLGTLVTSSVFMIPSVIFVESSLSYLGLGLKGMNSFGVILSENQQFISSNSYLILIPSIIMALMMISFNLFGNGLRDAFNPSLKGSE